MAANSPAGSSTETPTDPIHLDGKGDLQEAVAEYDVVLTEFYADWCGPCRMLDPVIESIATDTNAAVAKVDVDSNQALAGAYDVQGVPTLVLFVDGELVERQVGAPSEAQLRALVEQHGA